MVVHSNPSEALLLAMRRGWKEREEGAPTRQGFAPAAVVARAVGELVMEAATHDARDAAPGVVAGCGEGMARLVDAALARLVLDGLARVGTEGAASLETRAGPGVAEVLRRAAPSVPPPAFWAREAAWSPRVVARPVEELAAVDPASALWPPQPAVVRELGAKGRAASAATAEPGLMALAWRVLEAELEPSNRRLGRAGRGGVR